MTARTADTPPAIGPGNPIFEETRAEVSAAREAKLADLVRVNAALVAALTELIDACDDEALDDREDDGYLAALDRQSSAMTAAEQALQLSEGVA